MVEKISLKDALFNPEKVTKIAQEIKAIYPDFQHYDFITKTLQKFPNLELKERIYHIRDMLHIYLPSNYTYAVTILLDALPVPLDENLLDDDFGDFIYAPYSEFITAYGCTEIYLDFSLNALREMTKRFSVEFAIRDFINTFPDETLTMLAQCAVSCNYHERRLSSECLRPKLPWAKNLTIDYKKPLKHLELLYTDTTRYVTRSVANHLNDIAKIDASLVVDTLKRWKASKKQNNKEMAYIISHALRTLVKDGNEEALLLLGYELEPPIKVSTLVIESHKVNIGKALVFSFSVSTQKSSKLMIDYIIHFKTKSGSWSPKVYKLKKLSLRANEDSLISKKHLFRANMSTRKLYTGNHKLEIQINGKIHKEIIFLLEKEKE